MTLISRVGAVASAGPIGRRPNVVAVFGTCKCGAETRLDICRDMTSHARWQQQQQKCSTDGCTFRPVSYFNLRPHDADDILDAKKCRMCNAMLYEARARNEARQQQME